MFCSKCGANLHEDAAFCGECGNKIRAREPISAVSKPNNTSDKVAASSRNKLIPGIIIAAVIVIATVVLAFLLLGEDKGQTNDVNDDVTASSSTPHNAYDIAGLVGMSPSNMKSWLNSYSYTTYDGGGDSFARILIDGSKEVPATDDPSSHTGWKTLSVQMYTLYSSVPTGSDIKSIFDDNESVEISPSALSGSHPRAASFISTERAKSTSDLPNSTMDYAERLLSDAGFESNDVIEADGDTYAIGSCEIDGEEGIWLVVTEKDNGSYNGFVLCGYADDMKQSLSISDANAASLGKLTGIDDGAGSGSASSQSDQKDQPEVQDYTVTPSGADSTYTNVSHGYSITVPSSCKVSVSDFGNKLFFSDEANSMQITVSCTQNYDNLTVQQCYDRLAAGKDISYKFVGSESCVASYILNGEVHYDKEIVGGWSVLSITFTYPEANKATCDKLLEQIVKTIEPGDLNAVHEI